MPQPFAIIGGARLGWTNATYPLAKLTAGPDKLTAPDQIRTLARFCSQPLDSRGMYPGRRSQTRLPWDTNMSPRWGFEFAAPPTVGIVHRLFDATNEDDGHQWYS